MATPTNTFKLTLTTCQHYATGPEYWKLNKRWRLCSEGRKQSPIDVRTDKLVFDHLLEPIELTWLPTSAGPIEESELELARLGQQNLQVRA